MCGISGLWLQAGLISEHDLRHCASAMSSALIQRGPDDAGVWSDSDAGLALAHRRLSILDLSTAGHQPMTSSSGRFVIVFNGEIYNHLDLREQLNRTSSAIAAWRGSSDTETLLSAIEAWGLEEALTRCAGMFSLALWDCHHRQLYLARDRFGEKPLYWGWVDYGSNKVLVFASELSAIRACPIASTPSLNPASVSAFLQAGHVPAPLSIYSGIQQLPPGNMVAITDPHLHVDAKPWWDVHQQALTSFAQQASVFNKSEHEIIDHLEFTLRHVISEQSVADVPLGTFLSGGIDSTLITALLQSVNRNPVRSFTVSFPDEVSGVAGYNEAPYAAAVAAYLGTCHTEVSLTASDALNIIPYLPQLYCEPFADSSQLPTHLVCREARRAGLTVALSGDGGDEFFGGYNRHRLAPMLHKHFGSLPYVLRRIIAYLLKHTPVPDRGLVHDKRRKLADSVRSSGSLEELYRVLTTSGLYPAPFFSPELQQVSASSILSLNSLLSAPSQAEQLMLADVITYLPMIF